MRPKISSQYLERCWLIRPPINQNCRKKSNGFQKSGIIDRACYVSHLPVSIIVWNVWPFRVRFVVYLTSVVSLRVDVPEIFPRRRSFEVPPRLPLRPSRKASARSWSTNKLQSTTKRWNFMTGGKRVEEKNAKEQRQAHLFNDSRRQCLK